jgi:hypothetical protein
MFTARYVQHRKPLNANRCLFGYCQDSRNEHIWISILIIDRRLPFSQNSPTVVGDGARQDWLRELEMYDDARRAKQNEASMISDGGHEDESAAAT